MNKKPLIALLSLAAVLVLVLGTVFMGNPGFTAKATEADGVQAADVETMDPETVVATVDGRDIKVKDIQPIYASYMGMYSYYGYDVSSEETQNELYGYALNYAVQNALILNKAAEMGIVLTDEDKVQAQATYDEQIAAYEENLLAENENPTDADRQKAHEDTLAVASEQGYTIDMLEQDILITKLHEAIVKDVAVTDEDVQGYYDSLVAEDKAAYENDYESYQSMSQLWMYYGSHAPMYVPEGIRGVKHILLNVSEDLLAQYEAATAVVEESVDESETAEPTATPEGAAEATVKDLEAVKAEMIASVQATVDEIMAKFNAGTSFDALVAEYGQDPGMQTEPAITEGYRLHLDTTGYDKAFKDAAFNELQKVGDISSPVAGSFGVHILYYAGDIPSGPVAWTDEERESAKAEVLTQKQSEYFSEQITAWQAAAKVEYK